MKGLRILQVSFDTHIQPYQLSAFRGAVASKVGWEHEWFHNHNNTEGGYHNRYPLIQYKLDTYKGQMRPMLLCLDEAIEEAHHFFSKPDWGIDIKDTRHDLRIANLHVHKHTLNVWERPFTYRLHKWQAMNPDNYAKYKQIPETDKLARTAFLAQLLKNQITSFLKGVGFEPEKPFEVTIKGNAYEEWLQYKHRQKIQVFNLDFECTVSLPDFIGIGKGASRGLGVVRSFKR